MRLFSSFIFIIIFSCCGATVTFAPQNNDAPDSATVTPDAAVMPDATPAADTNPVQEDRAPVATDAGNAEDVQSAPDAMTRVCETVDTPYNGVDDDCNGWVDDDRRLTDGHTIYCDASRGCFWFCEPWTYSSEMHAADYFGYRGCCTSGHFRSISEFGGIVHGGMIVKGSDLTTYYIAGDRRRHAFPTTTVLASWFPTSLRGTGNIRQDAEACGQVTEISDVMLADIPIGATITYRPGTVYTGIFSDPMRYVVARGGVLRPIRTNRTVALYPLPFYTDRLGIIPDFVFVNYRIGVSITDPSRYDARAKWNTTIDRELGL